MADYRELLRKAVEALPENNGAARRQVYEKARNALVSQLRAINPPLPSREITQHRLQLEDCIRQVEQEATDALLGGLKNAGEPSADPVAPPPPKPAETPVAENSKEEASGPPPERQVATPTGRPARPETNGTGQSRDADTAMDEEPHNPSERSTISERPSISERPAMSDRSAGVVEATPPRRVPNPIENVIAAAQSAQANAPRQFGGEPGRTPLINPARPPLENGSNYRDQNLIRNPGQGRLAQNSGLHVVDDDDDDDGPVSRRAVQAAMSTVREVDVEPGEAIEPVIFAPDPQVAVDRAIAVLDREARGEGTEATKEPPRPTDAKSDRPAATTDSGFQHTSIDEADRGGNALVVFLVVFGLLLAGGGGAGYWAWHEGYIDINALFGRGEAPAAVAASVAETAADQPAAAADAPGNTTATPQPAPIADPAPDQPANALGEQPAAAMQAPALEAATPSIAEPNLAVPKIEDRLPTTETPAESPAATPLVADVPEPAAEAGSSQSLLLEASTGGATGGVPFSGTVDWSRGVDELGQPTLIAKANIPARNLGVDLLINKNCDPTLPASHIMEIKFTINDGFVGGTIARLGDVLFKNEELVAGTRLAGASARVAQSHFLYALSNAAQDVTKNAELMATRKWMDIEMVYGTGTGAIVVLEKDAAAEQLFKDVIGAWSAACPVG